MGLGRNEKEPHIRRRCGHARWPLIKVDCGIVALRSGRVWLRLITVVLSVTAVLPSTLVWLIPVCHLITVKHRVWG